MNFLTRFYRRGIVSLLLLLAGCGSDSAQRQQQAREDVAAPYAESAITVNIIAEPGMNAWNEMANSVTLLVIQGKDKPALEGLLANQGQLRALFQGSGTQENILKVDRYVVMPGQQNTLHIDRMENTRQIAVVAGYYPFPSDAQMARVAIPVSLSKSNWWSSDWQAILSPLKLNITLGSLGIVRFVGAENLRTIARKSAEGMK